MTKNILLLFLSPVKPDADDKYEDILGEEGTKGTSESAVRWILNKDIKLDKIFVLASEKIRKPIDGLKQTHLYFFRERLKKFLPNVDDIIEVITHNEKNSVAENLKSVADMAEKIQNYAAQFSEDKIILHVDLTGGMRDVNIMMLDLTRLLEYSGFKISKILYSNFQKKRVEPLKNIYDLFQLIAGVEEFVNFGSVTALDKYYADKTKSEQLEQLFDSMRFFAQAIKLCHYGQFNDAIEQLHDALRFFEENSTDDVEDSLMRRLIGKIRKDYHDLIVNRKKDDLKIIRWCLERDYLQQALTLFTERVPEYLGEKGIIIQTPEETDKLTERVDKDEMRRNRFYYLLNVYKSKDHNAVALKKLCAAVKTEAVGKKIVDVDALIKKIGAEISTSENSLADETRFRSQLETFNKLRREPEILLDLSSPEIQPISEIINQKRAELAEKNFGIERRKIIFDFVNKELANKDFTKFFPGVIYKKQIFDKFPAAHKVYELIADENFSVTDEEQFLNVMNKYFRIQKERNQSNHARPDFGEFKTANELRAFMSGALDDIEKLVAEKNSKR